MNKISSRIWLAALWLLVGGIFLWYRTLAIRQDAYNASLIKEDELFYLGVFAIFAVLALVLKGKLNRKTNIIAGIIVGIIQMIVFVDGFVEYQSANFNILTIISILIMAYLVFFATRQPKDDATA